MKTHRKIALIFSILFYCATRSMASTTDGYIVTLKSDTIYGKIQLSSFDQVSGALMLNGIEEESFHSRVVFSPDKSQNYKAYFPEMLLGFGFKYKNINYTFQQAVIRHKSIFKSDNYQTRFVRVLYKDSIKSLTKDIHHTPNPGLLNDTEKYLKYNSYIFKIKIRVGKADTLRIQQK
jgi:hypothetical protein